MTLTDHIVIMKDGHLQQNGTPTEVYQRPKNMFVTRVTGSPSINILPGMMTEKSRKPALEIGGIGKISLPPSPTCYPRGARPFGASGSKTWF